ncbi:hypothetical protein TYRP_003849 [Tyrophagus putrescentiae]|nr:hypothetical protein TYRP_003849 [Tyrophagus putrescentiae]
MSKCSNLQTLSTYLLRNGNGNVGGGDEAAARRGHRLHRARIRRHRPPIHHPINARSRVRGLRPTADRHHVSRPHLLRRADGQLGGPIEDLQPGLPLHRPLHNGRGGDAAVEGGVVPRLHGKLQRIYRLKSTCSSFRNHTNWANGVPSPGPTVELERVAHLQRLPSLDVAGNLRLAGRVEHGEGDGPAEGPPGERLVDGLAAVGNAVVLGVPRDGDGRLAAVHYRFGVVNRVGVDEGGQGARFGLGGVVCCGEKNVSQFREYGKQALTENGHFGGGANGRVVLAARADLGDEEKVIEDEENEIDKKVRTYLTLKLAIVLTFRVHNPQIVHAQAGVADHRVARIAGNAAVITEYKAILGPLHRASLVPHDALQQQSAALDHVHLRLRGHLEVLVVGDLR